MAGDWIKMRESLHEDPAVLQMAHRLQTRPEHVVGYCHRFWSWVSRNSPDGRIVGVTPESVTALLSLPESYLSLMVEVGWLETKKSGSHPILIIPKFDVHMSDGAKVRARNAANQRHRRVTETSPRNSDTIPARLRRAVFARDRQTCRYCGFTKGSKAQTGEYVGATLSIDHVIPASRGGVTSADNCVTCCTVCNRKKNGRTPAEAGLILSPLDDDKTMTRGEESREDVKESKPKKVRTQFVQPTLQEVAAYCLERGQGVDPQRWFDHYESNGWKVGNNAMKDWRAAVRKWENSDYANNGATAPKKSEYRTVEPHVFKAHMDADEFKIRPYKDEITGRWYGELRNGRKIDTYPTA